MAIERIKIEPKKDTDRKEPVIDINDDWGITSDAISVTIHKKGINQKTGELYYSAKWHYNNFVQALQALVDRDIQVCGTLHDVVKRIEELREDIKVFVAEKMEVG